MKLPYKLITTLFVCAFSASAWSVSNEDLARQLESLRQQADKVKISGFITASTSQTGEDVTYFPGQFGVGSLDNDANTEADAIIGLQFDIKAAENVDVVAQIRGQGPRGFNGETSLAFVRYKGLDNTQIRAGLLRVPFFMLSEFIDVGYAYPWITPPAEVYGAAPGAQYSGIDVVHNMTIGDWSLKSQPFIGADCLKSSQPTSALDGCFDNIHGVSFGLSDDYITLHANWAKTDVDFITNSTLIRQFSQAELIADIAAAEQVEAAFGTTDRTQAALNAAIQATSEYGVTNDYSQCNGDATCQATFDAAYAQAQTTFDAIMTNTKDGVLVGVVGGFVVDDNLLDGYSTPSELIDQHVADIRAFPNPDLLGAAIFRAMGFTMVADRLTLMGEAVNIDVVGNSRDTEASYITAAYNVTDTLQFHITSARVETDDNQNRYNPITGKPTILNRFYDQEQKSIRVGVRYDVFSNLAVKAEAEEISDFHDTYGLFDPTTIGFDKTDEYTVFRIAVDAVF